MFVRKNNELKVLKDIRDLTSTGDFSELKDKISDVKFLEYTDKNGRTKNLLPGYMFINCSISREILKFLYSVKEVVGFLNHDRKNPDKFPVHLSNLEVNNFFSLLEKKQESDNVRAKKTPKILKKIDNEKITSLFSIGDIVLVKDGLFKNSQGSIIQVKRNSLTVNIEFLGRFTPVSIDSSHCEKI